MFRNILTVLATAAVFAAFACTPQGPQGPDKPKEPVDTTTVQPVDTTAQPSSEWDWVDGYPVGVTVEPFTEDFSDGKKCSGFIATIDFSANPNLRFSCLAATKKKQGPSVFYANFDKKSGNPCIATNAGYFAGNTSVSLVAHRGEFVIRAFQGFNWPSDENAQLTMYPVRSALGQMMDGSFEIQWVYCTDRAFDTHTVFPSWLDNNEKTETFMDKWPSDDYCEGTWTWKPIEAVGGGPRLLKDGVDISTDAYWGECLNAGGTSGFSRVPRTAAGIKADGTLVLLVCDGRGAGGSAGYTLAELSAKLLSLGCVNAMNFDGGGSSCMVGAEGAILNNPSDGSERPVTSAIVISEIPH